MGRPLADAGGVLVGSIFGLFLMRATLPALTALATGWVVSSEGPNGLAAVAVPLAALGLAVLAGQVLSAMVSPLMLLARGRIDGAHRAELATLAVGVPVIEVLETAWSSGSPAVVVLRTRILGGADYR
jgi:hypothetical protein